MKTSEIATRVDFHIVLRIIPETSAYSVTIGEIQDGRFVQTGRRPKSCACDWEEVKENPLAPGQSYVSVHDLLSLLFHILTYCDDVKFFPNMFVFIIKDFPVGYETAQEEDEE
jgi:hypothetical protein